MFTFSHPWYVIYNPYPTHRMVIGIKQLSQTDKKKSIKLQNTMVWLDDARFLQTAPPDAGKGFSHMVAKVQ